MKILVGIAAFALAFLVLRALSGGGRAAGTGAALRQSVTASEEGVRQLLAQGRKIEAIKLYRELHHVGLKEAKEAVERLPRTPPAAS